MEDSIKSVDDYVELITAYVRDHNAVVDLTDKQKGTIIIVFGVECGGIKNVDKLDAIEYDEIVTSLADTFIRDDFNS